MTIPERRLLLMIADLLIPAMTPQNKAISGVVT